MISIIIPMYNAEKTIERCLNSVLNQTYKNIEIIVVDDGSNDRGKYIVSNYLHDNRIRYYCNENHGVSYTRNYGLKHANGEYVIFIDSDDYVDEIMLEKMHGVMKEDIDLVVCGKYFDEKGNLKECGFNYHYVRKLNEIISDFPELYYNGFFHSPVCKLYRKDKITSYFPEEYAYGEDLLFNLSNYGNYNGIIVLSEIYYYYDISNSTLTFKLHKDEEKLIDVLYIKTINFYQKYIDHNLSNNKNICCINNMSKNNYLFLIEKKMNNGCEVDELIRSDKLISAINKSGNIKFIDKLIKNKHYFLVKSYYAMKKSVRKVMK